MITSELTTYINSIARRAFNLNRMESMGWNMRNWMVERKGKSANKRRNGRHVHACDWHYFYGIFIVLLVRLQCNEHRCAVLFMIATFRADFKFYFLVKIKFLFAAVRA